MYSQLNAELVRARQHEIAAAVAQAQHRRELVTTKRDSRIAWRGTLARFPRVALIAALVLSVVLAVATAAIAAT
jgi:hypothetical protein